jgi:hypothetical protein
LLLPCAGVEADAAPELLRAVAAAEGLARTMSPLGRANTA